MIQLRNCNWNIHIFFSFLCQNLATDAGSQIGIKSIPDFAAKVQFFVILFIKSTNKTT